MEYKPTIGLEIHAELETESKLFCGCKNDPNEELPNTNICPICMGYPGAMPYINKKAIESMVNIGRSLGGEIADFTEFDRKHYFYPDIPKGYQISQYENPIVKNAKLLGIGVERIHLEEDTGKSSHDGTQTLIDFNRSGVPLMELVTKPEFHDSDLTIEFGEYLQLTLRYLGIAKARMEWGEMRVEANISVSKTDELGTKVEVKNINSFKAVKSSIDYEIKRQIEVLESGGEVKQETRGWDEKKQETFSQRTKETAQEYRYMPEPDIPKFFLSKLDFESSTLELPEAKFNRYVSAGVPDQQARSIVRNIKAAETFDKVIELVDDIKLAANYMTTNIMSKDDFSNITAEYLAELVKMVNSNELSSRGVKDIIEIMISKGGNPREVAEKEGLFQDSNEETLKVVVDEVISENKSVFEEYKGGKEQSLQFLVGQVMKKTKGTANPLKVKEIIEQS